MPGQAIHHLDTNGEVRAVQQGAIAPFADGANFVELVIPSGGAHDHARPIGQAGAHIGDDRLRRGEIDDHVELRPASDAVRAEALAFSSSPMTRTLCPRWLATSATTWPVLPRPSTKKIMVTDARFLSLFLRLRRRSPDPDRQKRPRAGIAPPHLHHPRQS